MFDAQNYAGIIGARAVKNKCWLPNIISFLVQGKAYLDNVTQFMFVCNM